jgi:(E)-4-hydroxy-3-methylbut-2-enyl-diphosphate synthase
MARKRRTRKIMLGGLQIGGGAPVVVQSMTKTDTCDVNSTVAQIKKLQAAGCEAIRVAVLNPEAADAVKKIKRRIKIPMIADIHFDHKLALAVMENGVDGLRINPGNIGSKKKIQEVVSAAKDKGVPIRIGVNAGSLEKDILRKYKHPTARALVESARRHINILEDLKFRQIKVSLKASDVMRTVEAYRLFAEKFSYPTHIGISEAGPAFSGTVKSAVGLGMLLSEGIGDTMRVSLTADPVEEVKVAYEILKSLHLRQKGPELISCPTCGRCQIDIRGIVDKVEAKLAKEEKQITVAVMGCIVNGPGEAREADIGIAGGKGMGILFKRGKKVKTLKESELFSTLMKEISKME